MATQNLSSQATKSNPTIATINYVTRDGAHISGLTALAVNLEDTAWFLEEEAGDLKAGKSKVALLEAAKAIRDLTPDTEAMPPEPDPIAEAQKLLWKECQRAQELLQTEAQRQRKDTAIREAFAMPEDILTHMVQAVAPDNIEEGHKAAKKVLEDAGWIVFGFSRPGYAKCVNNREPLRQLSAMIGKYPLHFLTSHVLAVLHYAVRWCENTSLVFRSPISARADGIAPEGVLFPRISMDFHPFKNWRDTPKEWREPLVNTTEEVSS